MRVPLATSLQSRDGTVTKDARIVNGMVEAIGESSMVRKRPGLSASSFIRTGIAQLLYWWNNLLVAIVGDNFSFGTAGGTPSLAWTNYVTGMPSSKVWAVSCFGGGRHIAVASDGTTAYSTDDGATWSAGGAISARSWVSAAYNGSVFCFKTATGYDGTAVTSDGITWNEASGRFPSTNYAGVASNGTGQFVCPRYLSTDVATSSDGVTWTVSAGALPSADQWLYIAWNGSTYCTVTNAAVSTAATSSNGTTWTARTLSTSTTRSGIVGGNGVFIVPPSAAGATSISISSNNGASWSSASNPTAAGINGTPFYVGGAFIVFAIQFGTNASQFGSIDGLTWTSISGSTGTVTSWASLTSSGTSIVLVGQGNSGAATRGSSVSPYGKILGTSLSPANAGLQFTAQDSGSNAATSLLMIKNATQAWTVNAAGTFTQITDVDYPGTYTVTATSLTRSGTVATVTLPVDANFQVGSTVTIAGATPSAYNGAQTVTGVVPSSSVPSKRVQVNITRSGTTATATTVSEPHTFKTGDVVPITGASQAEYNGSFTVTYISATQFSFTVTTSNNTTSTPVTTAPTTPATGSPIFSFSFGTNNATLAPTVAGPTTSFIVRPRTGTTIPCAIGATALAGFGGFTLTVTGTNSDGSISVTLSGAYDLSISGGIVNINFIPSGSPPAVSSLTYANGVATLTTGAAHNLLVGASFPIFVSGATQTQYNGNFTATATSTTTLTYPISVQTSVTTSTSTSPATPATGTIFAGTPGSASGYSFTFTIGGSPTTPATGTITAAGGRNTVPGIAYINGYFCVMDVNGVIYNSAEDNPASWTALEYVTAQAENGAGKAIAKSLNYLVAFKEWSTEFFYDAKNEPPGSPFSPVDNGFTQIGCASGDSLAEVDGSLMWIAQVRQRGRSVYAMRGTDQQKVSTPDVERIINLSTLASVFAYGLKVDGHTLYVLTLVDLNITLVYDAQSQTWAQWSTLTPLTAASVTSITRVGSTATVTCAAPHGMNDGDPVTISGALQAEYNGIFQISLVSTTVFTIEVTGTPVTPATGTILETSYTETYFKLTKYANAGGVNTFLHESTGVTSTMSSSVYRDNGSPINLLMRTSRLDGGTLSKKTIGSLMVIGDSVADTIMLRWSDDDYTTFTKYRPATLSNQRPMVRRCGSFRRRSIDARHVGNNPIRLESLELGQ